MTARVYGRLKYDGRGPAGRPPCWVITAEPHVMIRLKRIFPRIQANRLGEVTLVDTPEIARDLEWVLERWPLSLDDLSVARLRARATAHRTREEEVEHILSGGQLSLTSRLGEPARPARDYQLRAADLCILTRRLLLLDELGLGKGQEIHGKVLTPSGWREIGCLVVGDRVIGSDGRPVAVTGVYPRGRLPLSRVTFNDGASLLVDNDHLWSVADTNGRSMTVTTEQMATGAVISHQAVSGRHHLPRNYSWSAAVRLENGHRRLRIPMVGVVEYQPLPAAVPIDPYMLGVYLGDGTWAGGSCLLSLHVDDAPTLLTGLGVRVNARKGLSVTAYLGKAFGLQLKSLGLDGCHSWEKFVPDHYLRATPAQRLALLQGLMDTDGHALTSGGGTEFSSTSEALADAVIELARSLGGVARKKGPRVTSYTHNGELRRGRPSWRVNVKLPAAMEPFRVPRKLEMWIRPTKYPPTRMVDSVEPAGNGEVVCISVDAADRLYVAEDFVVTHNTMTSLLVLRAPDALPAVVVTLTHLPQQWMNELWQAWPSLRGHIVTKGSVYQPRAAPGSDGADPDVLILNYAKLAGWADHLAEVCRTVIFDEVQELRRNSSDKYMAAARLSDACTYRLGLSATPVYNYGGEIFNVVSVLDRDVLGDRNEFSREWGLGSKEAVHDPEALGAYLRDQNVMLRRTRREVRRELPEALRIPVPVDIDTATLANLTGDAVGMARMILAAETAGKDRFRLSGDLDWRMRHATGVAKAPYVADFTRMLLETDEQVVLFGWHHGVYDIWAERLKAYNPAFYTGNETPAVKNRNAAAFLRGDSRVLVMSLRAGAGLDGLQEVCHIGVFGELDWSPGVHDQCLGRLRRDGMDEPVVGYYCMSDEGSDPIVADVLGVKRMQSGPMIDPDAAPFEMGPQGDRVRLLAEEVIRRAGQGGRLG